MWKVLLEGKPGEWVSIEEACTYKGALCIFWKLQSLCIPTKDIRVESPTGDRFSLRV